MNSLITSLLLASIVTTVVPQVFNIVIDPAMVPKSAAGPPATGSQSAAAATGVAPKNAAGKRNQAVTGLNALPFPNMFGRSIPAPGNPYGPKAYGLGLNNRGAFPHNVFEASRYVAVAKQYPNTLVRFDADGEIELTNQFGVPVEFINDGFGGNVLELHDL